MIRLFQFTAVSALMLGAAAPSAIGPNARITWVSPTLDVNNNPETLSSMDLAIATSDVDLNVVGSVALRTIKDINPGDGVAGYSAAVLVAGLPNGTYKVWIRAIDLAGNMSVWGSSDAVPVDVTAPKPPSGISCKPN